MEITYLQVSKPQISKRVEIIFGEVESCFFFLSFLYPARTLTLQTVPLRNNRTTIRAKHRNSMK